MEIDDTFIITGGFDWNAEDMALNSVVRYNSSGVSEVLPSLIEGRFFHACASYLNSDWKRVSCMNVNIFDFIIIRLDSIQPQEVVMSLSH